jgi:hypothetical protein
VSLKTLVSFARAGQLGLMYEGLGLARAFFRVSWLASAAKHGVLATLAGGPVPFERLAADLDPNGCGKEALKAWLQLGPQLGELQLTSAGYSLRGSLARKFAAPKVRRHFRDPRGNACGSSE